MVKKTKGLDVRKKEDMKPLMALFQKYTTVYVLVHADYCGHCQTYKERVWNKLQDIPNKKNGMAAIHYDQLEGTPLANAKYKGYPSVLVVRKKANQTPETPEPLEIQEFEDEENPGQTTNAMPMEQANDPTLMESLVNASKSFSLNRGQTGIVRNAIDDVVKSLMPMSQSDEDLSEDTTTRDMTPEDMMPADMTPAQEAKEEMQRKTTLALDDESEQSLISKSNRVNINGVRNSNRLNNKNIFAPPPDPTKDVLDSQKEGNSSLPFSNPREISNSENDTSELPSKGVAVGGSLYASLLAAAPAVALTGTAMLMKRKTRRGKKASKGKSRRRGKKSRGVRG